MEMKVILPAAASAIAAIISLIVAAMNWKTCCELERVKRSYDLIYNDLQRLLRIKFDFQGMTFPSESQMQAALKLDGDEMKVAFQELLDEVTPTFNHLNEIFLVNKDVFDEIARTAFREATNGAEDWTGSEALGRRIMAVQLVGKAIVDQTERTRAKISIEKG